nr:hypothetical protein Cplu_554 [Cedratvirus plubellavi]
MQADDLFEKKVALDEHINFIREQLLYTDDPVETKRLLAILDDLLSEQLQLEDYLSCYYEKEEKPLKRPSSTQSSPTKRGTEESQRPIKVTFAKRVAKELPQRAPATGVKPLGEIQIGTWVRPEGEGEWFRLSTKYPKYITVIGENNQTMYINSNRYSEPWEYRE